MIMKNNGKKEITVFCLGDSHTGGYPLHSPWYGGNKNSTYQFWMEKYWNENLSKKENLKLLNFGLDGDTTAGMYKRLKEQVEHFKNTNFTYVLFMGGSNDLVANYSRKSVNKVIDNISDVNDLLFSINKKLIVCTIPPAGEGYDFPTNIPDIFQHYNDALLKWIKENKVLFIDTREILSYTNEEKEFLVKEYDLSDGIHLNIDGYAALGEFLAKKLKEITLEEKK